jgi:hypothetical protein
MQRSSAGLSTLCLPCFGRDIVTRVAGYCTSRDAHA